MKSSKHWRLFRRIAPPIVGMTLPFSLTVLVIWRAFALVVSFGVFTKQDILN